MERRRIRSSDSMNNSSIFQVRTLVWDEIEPNIHESEKEEWKSIFGKDKLQRNEDLKGELLALVEILQDFQQQNAQIRERIQNRPTIPEASSRILLRGQIKLLAEKISKDTKALPEHISKEKHLLDYAASISNHYPARVMDIENNEMLSINKEMVRPTSVLGSRNVDKEIGRPDSGVSVTEQIERVTVNQCLNLQQVDQVKENIHQALNQEYLLLLQDIEFVQECLDMENDQIKMDQKRMNPPSMSELRQLSKKLSKTWLEQDDEKISNEETLNIIGTRRKSLSNIFPACEQYHPLRPPPTDGKSFSFSRRSLIKQEEEKKITDNTMSKTVKIRSLVQTARDEQYFI